jgi:hypothetical protein
MRQKIYLELVILKPDNAVPLTEAEQQAIPCHFLLAQEAEKRLLVIDVYAGVRTGHQGPDYRHSPAGLLPALPNPELRGL